MMAKLKTLKIDKIIQETENCKSFLFKDRKLSKAKPGQFYMVWVPGVEEFPMGVSYIYPKKEVFGFTAWKVGTGTEALHQLKEGTYIGVRGPYGNWFNIKGSKIVCVAGAIEELAPIPEFFDNKEVVIIQGKKRKEDIIYEERLKNSCKLILCTEDGSCGLKGTSIEILDNLLKEEKFDQVLACGSESFLLKVAQVSDKYNIPSQLCGGRYMKCAVGICGSCVCNGVRTCKKVVLTSEEIKKLPDFGKFMLDKTGKKISI